MTDANTKAIAVTRNEDALSSIKTLDDAFKVLAAAGVVPVEIKELGTGFEVLSEKDQLVGKPLLIMGMMFNKSEIGAAEEFVSLYCVTEDGGKWIVNDGGTGIYAQSKRYSEKGITSLIIRKGLVRSDYTFTDANDGKDKPATTYYLSSV